MSEPGEQDAGTPPLINALADLWRAIQARHPEVPDVAIVLGSGTSRRRTTIKHGHFAAHRWIKPPRAQAEAEQPAGGDGQEHVHELLIGGESLVRGGRALFEVVMHEAAHALAQARGIKDTSRGGRYHNQKYAALARELGMDVAEDDNRSWTNTTAPATTAALYAPHIDALSSAITVYRVPETPSQPGSPTKGRMLAAECGCEPPRRIRMARSVFALGNITCSLCGKPFDLTG